MARTWSARVGVSFLRRLVPALALLAQLSPVSAEAQGAALGCFRTPWGCGCSEYDTCTGATCVGGWCDDDVE